MQAPWQNAQMHTHTHTHTHPHTHTPCIHMHADTHALFLIHLTDTNITSNCPLLQWPHIYDFSSWFNLWHCCKRGGKYIYIMWLLWQEHDGLMEFSSYEKIISLLQMTHFIYYMAFLSTSFFSSCTIVANDWTIIRLIKSLWLTWKINTSSLWNCWSGS